MARETKRNHALNTAEPETKKKPRNRSFSIPRKVGCAGAILHVDNGVHRAD